jgi:hypothetical protein
MSIGGIMQKGILICLVALMMSGCSNYKTAETAYHVMESLLAIATAEIPQLQASGIYSDSDTALANRYLTAVGNLNDQYEACLSNAQNTTLNKKSKFLDCLSVFTAGLTDPAELAALRVMSPKAQQKFSLYVVAFQVGLNAAIQALGGQVSPPVQVSSTTAPTKAELDELKQNILSYALIAR